MSKIKLIMPEFVRSSGHDNSLQMVSPRLIIGDKEFKVKRTDFNHGYFMEITVMVNVNDLDIIAEKDTEMTEAKYLSKATNLLKG